MIGSWCITKSEHQILQEPIVQTQTYGAMLHGKKCVTKISLVANFARHFATMTSQLFAVLVGSPDSYLT